MKQIVLFILIRIAIATLVFIVPAVIGFMLVEWLEPQFLAVPYDFRNIETVLVAVT